MHTTLDCVPCLMSLALRTARQVSADPRLHERVLRQTARALAEADWNAPPPVLAAPIFQRLTAAVGVTDPLRQLREQDNRVALELLPALRTRIDAAADPLAAALRICAAGNAIDFAACGELDPSALEQAIDDALDLPLDAEIDRFRRTLQDVDDLLWLADNAGEIVLDRLLIERLPIRRITVAVRGGPSLNDALRADAEVAGLDELARVIDNGSVVPGTVLAQCSPSFRERFRRADLIIAKGQGNYETLCNTSANLLFLLKVKCPVVAEALGRPVGAIALAWARKDERP